MTEYNIQEGRFPFPGEEWVDTSMNIIRHPKTHTSLIVTRAPIPAHRTFREELEAQWQQLMLVVEQLSSDPRQPVPLPHSPQAQAVETTSRFIRGEHTHHQRQLAVEHPNNSLLILTYTAMQPFSAEEDEYWERLKNTLVLTA